MRHQLSLAAMAVFVSAFAPSTVAAQADSASAPAFSVSAEMPLVSRYIWRGFDLSRKTASLQPYVALGMPLGFTASAWATSGLDSHRQVDEVDFTLDYTHELGGWALGAGYLHYVLTGTLTEPSADLLNPHATTTCGEVFVTLARNWDDGSATLKYSRGNRSMKGNSVNLRVEQTLASADEKWGASPYFSVDWLDQFGVPAAFADRLTMIQVGVPITRTLGPVTLLAAVHVSFVPSSWMRGLNAETGADNHIAVPWFSVGVRFEP
jgi:uncharacterized protein (TIGR02001 family)